MTGDSLGFFDPTMAAPTTDFVPSLGLRNNHPTLDFDAATDEAVNFEGVLPAHYAGNGIAVVLDWVAASATTGDVKWNVDIERQNAGTFNVDTDSFATAKTATTTTNGTNGVVNHTTISFSNSEIDGLLAGEVFRLRVTRDANDAADTMAGDAQLRKVILTEA